MISYILLLLLIISFITSLLFFVINKKSPPNKSSKIQLYLDKISYEILKLNRFRLKLKTLKDQIENTLDEFQFEFENNIKLAKESQSKLKKDSTIIKFLRKAETFKIEIESENETLLNINEIIKSVEERVENLNSLHDESKAKLKSILNKEQLNDLRKYLDLTLSAEDRKDLDQCIENIKNDLEFNSMILSDKKVFVNKNVKRRDRSKDLLEKFKINGTI